MPDSAATSCAGVAEQAACLTDSPYRLVLAVDGQRMTRLVSTWRHELNFGGVLSTLSQAVTYIVIVE